jgi:hypothetical protein
MRQSPPGAVHASRTAGPITSRVLVRVLGIATAIGVFVSLFGPFDRGVPTWLLYSLANLVFSWTGSTLGLFTVRAVDCRLDRGALVTGLVSGVAMAPLQGLIVWVVISFLNGRRLPVSELPALFWHTALICIASCFAATFVVHRLRTTATAAPAAVAPVKFLERLPLKLRGADIWAVEAEDHYLRLHTSKGQDLILLRLADAIAELDGIEGAQVHRSWWVAREAITDAQKGDGRATLTLKDGAEVPVSRTYAGQLREKRWI